MMKALLTGFEGYGAHGVNPTEQLVRALDGSREGDVACIGAVLPVTYRNLADGIAGLLRTHAPDIAILLGLWPGEACIRLERFALNWNAFEIPDNAGLVERGPVRPGAPLAYPAGLPVERITGELLAAGIPARASSSAGNFLCNAIFYSALDTIVAQGLATRAVFVHVPYLPEQVAGVIRAENRLEIHQRADLASMALETQLAALRHIIRSAAVPAA